MSGAACDKFRQIHRQHGHTIYIRLLCADAEMLSSDYISDLIQ
jgi:hypothetical protein